MEVEYELTMEDLIAFHRYHRQNGPQAPPGNNPVAAVVAVVLCIALFTAMIVYVFIDNPTATWYLTDIPFIGIGAALFMLGVAIFNRLTKPQLLLRVLKQGRNAAKALGWRRLSIDAEAIRSTSEFAASTYLWHGIDKLGATLDHAFFYINTTTAIVVPGRAFPDERAFKEFVDTARRYYRMGEVGPEAAGWKSPTSVRPSGDAEGIVRRPSEPEA